jgi:hypothetical protein
MSSRFKTIFLCIFFALIFIPTNAQLLQDSSTLHLVKKDIDYIYNLQFKEARDVYAKIVHTYPNHPIVFLLKGMITYWENYPLLHSEPAHISYEEDMRECIKISEKNEDPSYAAEYLLSDLCARGMLLLYYDDNELIMEVTPLTISTYKYLRRAFDYTAASTDMFYFTGLYNYYRETYPKAYPVYKSLAFLFPHGDAVLGLKQLQTAALNSVVLRAEASFLLIWIYMGFEDRMPESLFYCMTLNEKYPGNPMFLEFYIRNLLLMKKYDMAEKLLSSVPKEYPNRYFQGQMLILKGILQEKKYKNGKAAEELYKNGIAEISLYGRYGNEFSSYAYFGLSRISKSNDEKQTRKTYRKEAEKLSEFKKIDFDK